VSFDSLPLTLLISELRQYAGHRIATLHAKPGMHSVVRGVVEIQLSFVVYPSALRFLNTDSVAMWYPPEDHPNRHDHHEDQCNYPFHFFPVWFTCSLM